MIQIGSANDPFTSPRIAFRAATALGRADAMGLLPAEERIETLDLSFQKHPITSWERRREYGRSVRADARSTQPCS